MVGLMGSWRVYVIEGTTEGGRVTVHVGIALDVSRRVHAHATGKVKATRGRTIRWLGNSPRMPFGEALALEASLKKRRASAKRAWAAEQRETAG
jgi:putative endonuclease